MKIKHNATALILAWGLMAPACGTPRPKTETADAKTGPTVNRLGDFTLKDVDNRTHALSDYLGKQIVVISFFAMWCEPCKKELVHLNELFLSHRDKGLAVIAISMDEPETQGEVRPFTKQRNFAFPVLLDTEGVAAGLFNQRRDAPYNLIIDQTQSIVWSRAGYTPGDEKMIEEAVLSAMGAAKNP